MGRHEHEHIFETVDDPYEIIFKTTEKLDGREGKVPFEISLENWENCLPMQ